MISHRLHRTPTAFYFLKAAQHGVVYADEFLALHFDCNSFAFRPVIDSGVDTGSIKYLFKLFRSTLRKYKAKHSHKLHLHFEEAPGLKRVRLHCLSLEIANHFRNLKELTIEFFNCQDLKDVGLKTFFSPIAKILKKVKNLNISINSCENFNDYWIKVLGSLVLHRLPIIETLRLNFSGLVTGIGLASGNENLDSVPYDTNILSRLYNRRTSKTNTHYSTENEVTSKGIYLLTRSLVRYLSTNLQQLTLVLPSFDNSNTFTGGSFQRKIIPALKNLKKLNLYLDTFLDEDDNLQKQLLLVALDIGRYLSKLEHLTLDLSSVDLPSKLSLAKFGSNIFSNLSNLKGFTIYSEDELTIKDQKICLFFAAMAKLVPKLEAFAFCFGSSSVITNKVINKLIQHINQDLHSLKRLTLDLKDTETDADAIQFLSKEATQSLEELNLYVGNPQLGVNSHFINLKRLTLSFENCESMTDSDFEEIVNALFSFSLTSLEELTLSFSDVTQLTDDGLEVLWLANWVQIRHLKAFTLELYECKNVSDITFGMARSCMQKYLKDLQSLTLIFDKSSNFSPFGITYLIKNITTYITNLENLHIEIWTPEKNEDHDSERDFADEMTDQIITRLTNLRKLKLYLEFYNGYTQVDSNVLESVREKLTVIPSLRIY